VGIDSSTADPGWEALARVAAGDTDAFTALVETHQERLLRLCERLLGDVEEARDAAQEVFLKAFRKAGETRPLGQVYTWLYRIAVNHCLNKLRRRKLVRFLRLEADSGEPDAPAFDPPDARPDPAATLEARRRWQLTRKTIAKLPDSQRA
jgi:RNA polymerase sigma-70 factor, ECF subfamily